MKKPKLRNTRLVVWDIESSFNILAAFSLRQDYIPPDNIIQDWNILCGSWKVVGEDKIHSVSVKHSDVTNDYHVVKTLRDMIDVPGTVLIHHNGKKFDLKKLNTRIAFHGIAPLDTKIPQIDTLTAARKHFAFTSNKLDYLAQFFGVGAKLHTSGALWLACLRGDKTALKEMVIYNKQDVVILEAVYNKILPYIDHPNIAAIEGLVIKEQCIFCLSHGIEKHGVRVSASGAVHQRYRCTNCGKLSQARIADKKTVLK